MKPEMEVTGYTEHEDGSATIMLDMSFDMLIVLARRGMKALLEEATAEYGYPYTEGADNGPAREGRDSELFGEIPEL